MGGWGWGSVRYRFEIVVEVRCAISLSTGGIFTSGGADLRCSGGTFWEATVLGIFLKIVPSEC